MGNTRSFTNTNYKRMQSRSKTVSSFGVREYARMHASTIREIRARQERQEKEKQRILHDMVKF